MLLVACGGASKAPAESAKPEDVPSAPSEKPEMEAAPVSEEQDALERSLALSRGGRLFDKWWVEGKVEFSPDDSSTDAPDGKGGPFGDGTLPGADGKPLSNPGHDYRIKNLFGWDLRGAEGIYGPKYQDKSYVLKTNLLTDDADRGAWIGRFTNGHGELPAYGKVLSSEQIGLIVDFILAVRDGSLAAPQGVFELSESAPKNYVLLAGGDAKRGQELIETQCSGCHGADGTSFLIDGKYSMGMYGRAKGYETWIKVLNGQPGTKMGPQLTAHAGFEAQSLALKDVLAALCDRSVYPKGEAKGDDVPDGDPRCGAYLK